VRKLIYSMNATLDGYIAARGDDIGWSVPSAELHQWFNDRAREIGVSLYGRKLWEVMSAHWPTADQQPDATPVEVEFARVWQKTPKVVFSATLDEVSGNARLVTGDAVAEITRLKAEDGAPMEIGGAVLAGRGDARRPDRRVPGGHAPGAGRRRHAVLQRAGHLGEPATRGDENLPDGVTLSHYEPRR
jgi:dihydrofolate reductase